MVAATASGTKDTQHASSTRQTPSSGAGTVFIVDDEQAMRESLQRLLQGESYNVRSFPDAETFLGDYDASDAGVLLLDIKMPGMNGLELQKTLRESGVKTPIIMISGHGTVPMSVQAMRNGAVDFIEKPFRANVLLERIEAAMTLDQQTRAEDEAYREVAALFAKLTPREMQIMNMVVDGKNSREIAEDLGISEKTVALHRAHFMKKTKAGCVADLVRLALLYRSRQEPHE